MDAKTGDERWRFKTGYRVYSSPAVSEGTVISAVRTPTCMRSMPNRRTTLEVQSRKLDFIFSGHSRGNDLFRMLGCLSICRRYGDRTGEVEIQNRVQNPRFKVTQSSWWRILTGLLMASDAQQSYSMLKSKPCVTTGSKLRYTSRHSGEFEVKMNDIRSYRAFLCSARKSRRN